MNTNFDNVNFGRKDGVEVHYNERTNEVFVVAPNQYDLTWQLKGKNQEGGNYSNQVPWNDTAKLDELSWVVQKPTSELQKKLVLVIPNENLNTPEKQAHFNNKVNKTRERVIEASKEYNQFFYKKDADGTYKTKTPSDKLEEFSYKAAWDEPGNRTAKFHFAKNDPKNPVLAGEVAHAGKYYAVLYTGHDKDNIKFEIVNTGKFLKGEDLKDQNRENAIQKILPVGQHVFIDRDKLGNVLEVSKEPIALEKNHPELVAVNKAIEAAKIEAQAPAVETQEPEVKPEVKVEAPKVETAKPEVKVESTAPPEEKVVIKKAPAKKKAPAVAKV